MGSSDRHYKKILASLPGRFEAFVTPKKDISDRDLLIMAERGIVYKRPVKLYEMAVLGECHAIAALAWLKNPDYRLVTGICLTEGLNESCDSWYFHSFCIDENYDIIEPTTHERDIYWGAILTDEEAREDALKELDNIQHLGFEIDAWMLQRLGK